MPLVNVKSFSDDFDVYVAFASEDRPLVKQLVRELEGVGLRIWFDEDALIVGESLRAQMDRGLRKSAFGIIVLSHAFFAKNWTQQELDGMMALEAPDAPRILPIWLGLEATDVAARSPMLAGRKAAVSDGTLVDVVPSLVRAISELLVRRGRLSTIVRLQTATGLPWFNIEFLESSLRKLDENWPSLHDPPEMGRPIDLVEAATESTRLDGTRVTLIGHQRSLQHFASAGDHDEWVFQVFSTQAEGEWFAYVRMMLPTGRPPPRQPDGQLTFSSGYFVARGLAMTAMPDGQFTSGRHCLYMVADRVGFLPQAGAAVEGAPVVPW